MKYGIPGPVVIRSGDFFCLKNLKEVRRGGLKLTVEKFLLHWIKGREFKAPAAPRL